MVEMGFSVGSACSTVYLTDLKSEQKADLFTIASRALLEPNKEHFSLDPDQFAACLYQNGLYSFHVLRV